CRSGEAAEAAVVGGSHGELATQGVVVVMGVVAHGRAANPGSELVGDPSIGIERPVELRRRGLEPGGWGRGPVYLSDEPAESVIGVDRRHLARSHRLPCDLLAPV